MTPIWLVRHGGLLNILFVFNVVIPPAFSQDYPVSLTAVEDCNSACNSWIMKSNSDPNLNGICFNPTGVTCTCNSAYFQDLQWCGEVACPGIQLTSRAKARCSSETGPASSTVASTTESSDTATSTLQPSPSPTQTLSQSTRTPSSSPSSPSQPSQPTTEVAPAPPPQTTTTQQSNPGPPSSPHQAPPPPTTATGEAKTTTVVTSNHTVTTFISSSDPISSLSSFIQGPGYANRGNSTQSSNSLSTGAKIGIGAGVGGGVLSLLAGIALITLLRKRHSANHHDTPYPPPREPVMTQDRPPRTPLSPFAGSGGFNTSQGKLTKAYGWPGEKGDAANTGHGGGAAELPEGLRHPAELPAVTETGGRMGAIELA